MMDGPAAPRRRAQQYSPAALKWHYQDLGKHLPSSMLLRPCFTGRSTYLQGNLPPFEVNNPSLERQMTLSLQDMKRMTEILST